MRLATLQAVHNAGELVAKRLVEPLGGGPRDKDANPLTFDAAVVNQG